MMAKNTPAYIQNPERIRTGMETNRTTGGVVWKFFKRTINITDYRNSKDEVNPAKNRTFGGIIHDWFVNLVISWFDIEDPDGNEMRWYRVLTRDTQVTGERQQP
jgi:hypothetical protein